MGKRQSKTLVGGGGLCGYKHNVFKKDKRNITEIAESQNLCREMLEILYANQSIWL